MDKWIKENKITTAIIVVLVVVLGVGYLITKNSRVVSNTADFDLQQKCAKAANDFYTNKGWNTNSDALGSNDYTNHWNKTLNKCFIEISLFSSGKFENYLYDVLGEVEYGEIRSFSEKGTIPSCSIKIETNFKDCKTQGEFDDFVKLYMED